MESTPESLSLPAKELLDFLTTVQQQLDGVVDFSLVADQDQPIAKLIAVHYGEVCMITQIDYRTALTSLMELVTARKVSIDELGERTWQFHLTTAEGH